MDKLQENIKKLNDLLNIKNKLHSELKNVAIEIEVLEKVIYNSCDDLHNGHKWITDVEPGMYGETFYVCEICGMNK